MTRVCCNRLVTAIWAGDTHSCDLVIEYFGKTALHPLVRCARGTCHPRPALPVIYAAAMHCARRIAMRGSDSSPVSERPRTTVSVGALHPGLQC